MNVGFIGLGTMGAHMVQNLCKINHTAYVYDIDTEKFLSLKTSGNVSACANPREVAQQTTVLFTCLPNDEIVEAVYLGPDGILEGAREGLITCDASTVSAQTTRTLAEKLASKGITHLDTPMLGSQPQAASGEIFFIVGGDKTAYEQVIPLLEAMGRKHQHAGKNGAANAIKLIHNSLTAVMSVAVAESLALCTASDVDLRVFDSVVVNGGGMAFSTYFDRRVGRMLDGDFSPMFSLDLMLKDVTLGRSMAEATGVDVPLMEKARATFEEASPQWGQDDFSAVSRVSEQRLGRKIFP